MRYNIPLPELIAADEYLLQPQHYYPRSNLDPRPKIAGSIIAFYFLLLLVWIVCFLRILFAVVFDPGFTARYPRETAVYEHGETEKSISPWWACARTTVKETAKSQSVLDKQAVVTGLIPAPPGLSHFYRKDVFVCDEAGLPLFCDYCNNWKPDRTHHCSEVGRCVKRFDHFCPW